MAQVQHTNAQKVKLEMQERAQARMRIEWQSCWSCDIPQKLCVDILRGIRDTTLVEDLEKELEDESKSQNMVNLLVHDGHPWGGCSTSEIVSPAG